VVRQPVEAPVADADRVGEAEEDADDTGHRDGEGEEQQGRQEEQVVDRLDAARVPSQLAFAARDDRRGARGHRADSSVSPDPVSLDAVSPDAASPGAESCVVGMGARKAMRAQSASMVRRMSAGGAPSTIAWA